MRVKSENAAVYTVKSDERKEEDKIIKTAMKILEGRMQKKGEYINSPDSVKNFMVLKMSELEHEVFSCLWLDIQNRVIEYQEMFTGTINTTSVYPREVIKAALKLNASAVVFCHNHPSGACVDSGADLSLTRELNAALEMVDVRLLDHIIVGGTDTMSFAERGLI